MLGSDLQDLRLSYMMKERPEAVCYSHCFLGFECVEPDIMQEVIVVCLTHLKPWSSLLLNFIRSTCTLLMGRSVAMGCRIGLVLFFSIERADSTSLKNLDDM